MMLRLSRHRTLDNSRFRTIRPGAFPFVCCSIIAWFLFAHSSATAQETPTAEHVSIAMLLEDSDGDFIPDRVGGRFEVEGYAIMEPRRARSGSGNTNWYFVTIEDGSAGVRLLTTDLSQLEGIQVGAWVVGSGELTHRRGSEELILDDILVADSIVPVAPYDALAREVNGEQLMHRLIRLEGILSNYDPAMESMVLEDRTGSVDIRVTGRYMEDLDFAMLVRDEALVTLVGIVGQADRTAPFDSAYRVQPRDPNDMVWSPSPPWLEASLVLLFLSLAAGLASFAYQRTVAVRRAGELELLTSNLTESKRSLEASTKEYKTLFEDDAVARFVLNADGSLRRWNNAFETFLDRDGEELNKSHVTDLFPDLSEEAAASISKGTVDQLEVKVTRRNAGTNIGLLAISKPDGLPDEGLRGTVVDLTHRKELEAQLIRTQKMEAVGRLAGGIAHDINNMLSVILGNAESIKQAEPITDEVDDEVSSILQAAERSSRLTRQLLVIARRDVADPEALGINEVVHEMVPMLQKVIGSDVELVTLLEDGIPDISADLSQLEQVILNLVVNAREAMPAGGKIVLETSRLPGDRAESDLVLVKVKDTGVGMDSETAARAFEPFYSTKEEGTGLGLSTVYGIVSRFGGTATCTSSPGAGTTFELTFPATSMPRTSTEEEEEIEQDAGPPTTVLLADDEPALRGLARRILERNGCTVIDAANGEEALRTFEKDPSHFDVVITDVVMPILGGWEMAERLTKLKPDLPIVFMSGYVDKADVRCELRYGLNVFVQKPFRAHTLIEALNEVLSNRPMSPQ